MHSRPLTISCRTTTITLNSISANLKEVRRLRESLWALFYSETDSTPLPLPYAILSHAVQLLALQNKTCVSLCPSFKFPARDASFVNERIREEYVMNWLVDGLPAAQEVMDRESKIFYAPGFGLGQVEVKQDGSESPFLNNHYDVIVHYHQKDVNRVRVVGVIVHPKRFGLLFFKPLVCPLLNKRPSVHSRIRALRAFNSRKKRTRQCCTLIVSGGWYAFSRFCLSLQSDPISWGTRWDNYLHVYDPQIHWFR